MSEKPTKADYRAYVERWRTVNDYERSELRRTSVLLKLKQLAALMASADSFRPQEVSDENADTWARWNRLRNAYRG